MIRLPLALRAALAGAVFALFAGRAAAEDAPGPIVELPKFVVTDSRELPQPEAWRYAQIPGFEVLSNASDRATQKLLRDFGMFRQALGHVWPLPNRPTAPTALILCGAKAKFDAFIPAGKDLSEGARASLFLKQGEQTAIVIDLQATTLNVLNLDAGSDAATGTDSGVLSVEQDKQLYREYIRYLLSRSEPRLPAWFEEGLSQIFMRMRVSPDRIEYAMVEEANVISAAAAATMAANAEAAAEDPEAAPEPGAPSEDRDFNVALRRRTLVPLETFFAVKHDSPEAMNPLGNNRWAKQAYAFVHMCLYGYNGRFQKPFTLFIQRAVREPVTEAMFQECFGMPFKKMQSELRSYIDMPAYTGQDLRAKTEVIKPPAPAQLRDATQSEVGRIKGETLVLAGQLATAKTELIAPYMRGERDPQLLAALGLFELRGGETERGRKFLEAAYAAKTPRADAMIELSRLRLAEATAKPAEGGQLSAAQTSGIVAPLLLVRREPPPRVALYELAAEAWLLGAAKPTSEQAQIVVEGARLFPSRMRLVHRAGLLAARAGDTAAAHALADHGLRYAPDAATKKHFEDLKASLPPAPAKPAKS